MCVCVCICVGVYVCVCVCLCVSVCLYVCIREGKWSVFILKYECASAYLLNLSDVTIEC